MDTTFSVAERDDDGTVEGRERVILIGLDTSVTSGWDMEETMEELESLVDTAGGVVVGQVIQRRQKPDPAYFIGKGKAEEVELMREAFEAELIVFNDELGPAQQRNLESVINAKVIDRTQLILDIFAQRAETAEGKLQVELAQLQYLLPRLTGKGTVLSRLGGGIGTRGPGETKLEMDKRVIRGRIADIKEQIEDVRKRRGVQRSKRQEANIPVLSLVGYTNAGKSSLLNKILGEERVIVSNIAGTTRDAIDSYFENESGKFLFIDTAGMRRKSKVDDAVEKYSNLRSIAAIERADVCLILIDANEGVTEQDTKVAGLAHEAGKACIIVVNKWDTVEKDTNTMDEKTAEVRRNLSYMTYAPVVFISALTGQRVDKLFDMIVAVSNQNSMRITTGMLNNILEDATARVQPPTDKGRRLKIYYITQVGVKPPHFVFFCNDSRLFHFSYQRYLENQIRAVFGLTGTPIRITIRQKGDKEDM